jgi:hypothetical protein
MQSGRVPMKSTANGKKGLQNTLKHCMPKPQCLVQGLIDRANNLSDVQILHSIARGNKPYADRLLTTDSGTMPCLLAPYP